MLDEPLQPRGNLTGDGGASQPCPNADIDLDGLPDQLNRDAGGQELSGSQRQHEPIPWSLLQVLPGVGGLAGMVGFSLAIGLGLRRSISGNCHSDSGNGLKGLKERSLLFRRRVFELGVGAAVVAEPSQSCIDYLAVGRDNGIGGNTVSNHSR